MKKNFFYNKIAETLRFYTNHRITDRVVTAVVYFFIQKVDKPHKILQKCSKSLKNVHQIVTFESQVPKRRLCKFLIAIPTQNKPKYM